MKYQESFSKTAMPWFTVPR